MAAPAPPTLAGAAPLLTMTGRVSNEGSRKLHLDKTLLRQHAKPV